MRTAVEPHNFCTFWDLPYQLPSRQGWGMVLNSLEKLSPGPKLGTQGKSFPRFTPSSLSPMGALPIRGTFHQLGMSRTRRVVRTPAPLLAPSLVNLCPS